MGWWIRIAFLVVALVGVLSAEAAEPPRGAGEYLANVSLVYGAQWTVYLITQEETIREHGSWDHFINYPQHPEFDKDSFDYNIFKHALSGSLYYQFYRYRGYSQTEAFAWTFVSSTLFEFAVETYTEKPSIQDIYQTPIYGALLGMGLESASEALRNQSTAVLRWLGYLLNPFSLMPDHPSRIAALPQWGVQSVGVNLAWSY